jgi:Cft2 family RNA processing exonuclease
MDRNDTVICTVIGRVETVGNDRQFIFNLDGTALPFSISGQDINPPWPMEMQNNQQWSVIPKIDSQGQIISLKGWHYQTIDPEVANERWHFTGQVQQVSKKHGRVFLATEFQHPKPQKTVLTLITTDIEKFSPNDVWQITAQRQGNILMIVDSSKIVHSPEKPGVTDAVGSLASDLINAPIKKSIGFQRKSAKDPDEQAAWGIVEESSVSADWEIQKPVWRSQSQQPYWEFAALQNGRGIGKLKVSIASGASGAIDPPHCEIIEFVIPVPREISQETKQRLNITPLGAARSIGASCFRVLIGPYEVVMDTGTRPKGSDPLPSFEYLENPDLLLITHAHQDHIGGLPVFHRLFPATPMFCSAGTYEIAQIMLQDGLKVQERNEDMEALFNADELDRSLFNLQITPSQEFEPLPGLIVKMIPAGHIVGAMCIHLQYGDRSLIYTGDYSLTNSNTTKGLRLEDLPTADILITEGTYGNINHPARKEQERGLVESVVEVIKNGGNVLIPAFALGRAQEIILILKRHAMMQGIKAPIYVDGLVRRVTDTFQEHLEFLPESVQNYAKTQSAFFSNTSNPPVISIEHARERPLAMAKPSIIIASSGMLKGGPSVYYAQTLLERENAAIFISGYVDEESPGRYIQGIKTGESIEIDGKEIIVRAQVKKFSLSAHVDKAAIGQVVEKVKPKHLILIHGSPYALNGLASSSDFKSNYQVHIPELGESIDITSESLLPSQAGKRKVFEVEMSETADTFWIPIAKEEIGETSTFAATGVFTVQWLKGGSLMLTPVKSSKKQVDPELECCQNCSQFLDDICSCVSSSLFGSIVDPSGKCPEFEVMKS